MISGDLFLLGENSCVWKEHVLGPMRRGIKSHLVFPTERRFIRKTNSDAVSERLLSHTHKGIHNRGRCERLRVCSQKPEKPPTKKHCWRVIDLGPTKEEVQGNSVDGILGCVQDKFWEDGSASFWALGSTSFIRVSQNRAGFLSHEAET